MRIIQELLRVPVPNVVDRALGRVLGLEQAEIMYQEIRRSSNRGTLPQRLLDTLNVDYRASDRDLGRITRQGPAVMVANHPYGILDAAVLASILTGVRPDVKFLANRIMAAIPEIHDLLVPIDPFGGPATAKQNSAGIKHALKFLASGGLLVVYPAGEVSHFDWRQRQITDPEWNDAIVRIVEIVSRRAPEISVIPAFIAGGNSLLFQAFGMVHPRLRTAMLVRELLNKRGEEVELRIGNPVSAERLRAFASSRERTDYLRWRTYLLANRNQFKPRTSLPLRTRKVPALEPVSAAVPQARLVGDVQSLSPDRLLTKSNELEVFVATAEQIPNILTELGRLRELTFRTAGEGTGQPSDLDRFDNHYLHLFVWNSVQQEVVGAYRLGATDSVRERFGVRGLYTATLFKYGDEFLDRIGPALELGRSFIRPEYQQAFAPLLLLWKGIGKWVAQNPRYKVLFGPVSISNQYSSISRQLIVSSLRRTAWIQEMASLVRARVPFRAATPEFRIVAADLEELNATLEDIEPGQPGVPVLLRQYLKLGGKLLGFNVDAKFANALDGLILVDLTKTEPKLLERYLGRAEAARFLEYQKGEYGTHEKSNTSQLDSAGHRCSDSAANPVFQIHRRA